MSVSESARATSSAESRFRIQAPNAKPRLVAVLPLDAAADALVAEVAPLGWNRAVFISWAEGADWLARLPTRTRALVEAIETANVILLVATAGTEARAAALIAEAAAARQVMIAALVVDSAAAPPRALETTLAALRPHAGMLVVADGQDYLPALLTALRA